MVWKISQHLGRLSVRSRKIADNIAAILIKQREQKVLSGYETFKPSLNGILPPTRLHVIKVYNLSKTRNYMYSLQKSLPE